MDAVEKESYPQNGDLRSVEDWASTLNFKGFKPRAWDRNLRALHKSYKELGQKVGPLRNKLERQYMVQTNKEDADNTAGEYVELAHLALQYGALALQYVLSRPSVLAQTYLLTSDTQRVSEARLDVFFEFGQAFPDAKSVDGHIAAAKNMVSCAEKALNCAETCYEGIKTHVPSVVILLLTLMMAAVFGVELRSNGSPTMFSE